MKVIKRDGRAVEYDRQKIVIAIQKANKEVRKSEQANEEQIEEIIAYIEELGKKRMLVEDIQDIIEQKLMEIGKYELAKKYIVYRYTRTLVRKQNTTDETILGLIRNENRKLQEGNKKQNIILAAKQRNYIAGEVSRDLTKRILLPEKISSAHEDGILYFHNADYFIQHIFSSCMINLGDMLDNGTVINGIAIESPKSFQVACIVTSQIIVAVANNQYGRQALDLKHLGKYLRKSKDKFARKIKEKYEENLSKEIINNIITDRLKEELESGIQTIEYQINTSMTVKGEPPLVTLFLHLEPEDEYIEENAMIVEEILKQRLKGIKDEEGKYIVPEASKLIYIIDEQNNEKYKYINKLAEECTNKNMNVECISVKEMKEYHEGKFDQGVVSINLPQIALTSKGNEEQFWKLLDERLEICKEALMCRHYALLGTISDISPIHWQNGAIARLSKGEKIDEYLKNEHSTLSLGFVGMDETIRIMIGRTSTELEGKELETKILKLLKERVQKWKKETGIEFLVCETNALLNV